MKKKQRLSPLIIKRSCFVLSLVLIILTIFIIKVGLDKNYYQLTGTFDEATGKYQIIIRVDHPKNEEITLQADDKQLISMEMLENFQSNSVDILPPATETESGIRLKIKADNKKVKLTLPILLPEEQTTNICLSRAGKIIGKKRIARSEQTKEKERKTAVSGSETNLLKMSNLNGSFSNAFLSLNNDYQTVVDKTAIVYNDIQLLQAFEDESVTKIEFGADISHSYDNNLTLKRSLVIDGKGYSLKLVAKQGLSGGTFNLKSTNNVPAIFEIKNLNIVYSEGYSSANAFIHCDNKAVSNFWTVKVYNVIGNMLTSFLYLPQGKLEVRGTFYWNQKSFSSHSLGGAVNATNILITDGAEVELSVARDGAVLRLNPENNNISTSLVVNKGSKVKLFSADKQAIWMNSEGATNEVIFEVSDGGTALECSSKGTYYGADGGVVTIQGKRDTAKGKYSRTEVLRGASLSVTAAVKASDNKSTSAFVNQVSGDGIFNIDGNAKVTLKAEGEAHNFCSAFRMRLVGNQTINVSNNAELNVIKKSGVAAAIRMYGKDNRFIIESGGKLNVRNEDSSGKASDGGDTGGRQGIQFTVDGGGTSSFTSEGAQSSINVYADKGPALESVSGNFVFNVGQAAILSLEGQTASANRGIIQGHGKTQVTIDHPTFYDFCNNRANGGQVFATGGNNDQLFVSKGIGLAVWEKRKGIDVNGNPDAFWNSLEYTLSHANFNTIASTDQAQEFNAQTFKGGSAYTRINGNNYRPIVSELHLPTNADKHVYGQVVVPYKLDGSTREAWEQEVWVELQLVDVKGQEKARQWVATHGKNDRLPGVSIYGEPARGGIFDWKLAEFLQTGETVNVLQVIRGDHLNLEYKNNIISLPEDIKIKKVMVQDVTPPSSLVVETQAATDAIKQIKGTVDLFDARDQRLQDEVYIFVKTARGYLTHSDGNNFVKVTAASESQTEGSTIKKWAFDLPAYLDVAADQSVEIFAKDTVIGEPEILGTAPATLSMEPNNKLGNLSPSIVNGEANCEYHDAVGDARFTPAVLLELSSVTPSAPTIRLEIPQSFDRDQNGKPMISHGNQFDFRITITSGDAHGSGKDPVKNLEVILSKSEYLSYYRLEQLTKHAEIAAVNSSDAEFKIKLKNDLAPGESITFTVTAKVEAVPEGLTTLQTVGTVRAESPIAIEDPFIPGPPDPSPARVILQNSASIDIVTGTRATLGEDVYLSVVNQQLRIYYSNVEKLAVYIDGTHYQDFTVKKQRVTDSLTLEIPVSEIRNHVSVKYKDIETGKEKIAYWNNHWSFMKK